MANKLKAQEVVQQMYRSIDFEEGLMNYFLEIGFFKLVIRLCDGDWNALSSCCGSVPAHSKLCPKLHVRLIATATSSLQMATALSIYQQACGWPPPQELDENIRMCLREEKDLSLFLNEHFWRAPMTEIAEYIRALFKTNV